MKIRPHPVARRPPSIQVEPVPPAPISFSYRYYAQTGKFGVSDRTGLWFEALLARLRALSALDAQEVLSSRSPSPRAHRIDFARTTEPEGFSHLNPQSRRYTPYQFQLSQGTGRVHGFFIDVVFHIVWLDPHHRLYARS